MREKSEAKLRLMGVWSLAVKSFNSWKVAQVSPSSNIQQNGEPGVGSFQFDHWDCLTLFMLMYLANQLMENIRNPNSDTAGFMIFKFLLFQLADWDIVTV